MLLIFDYENMFKNEKSMKINLHRDEPPAWELKNGDSQIEYFLFSVDSNLIDPFIVKRYVINLADHF